MSATSVMRRASKNAVRKAGRNQRRANARIMPRTTTARTTRRKVN